MSFRHALINLIVCIAVGGLLSAFTQAKWLAAGLWVFSALAINGSIAQYEDARSGGFENPDGSLTPEFAKGLGAVRFWLSSIAVCLGAFALGLYVQLL